MSSIFSYDGACEPIYYVVIFYGCYFMNPSFIGHQSLVKALGRGMGVVVAYIKVYDKLKL